MAEYLGYEFVDAARWIKFKFDGTVDQDASYAALRSLAEDRRVVIPGFYGVMPDGTSARSPAAAATSPARSRQRRSARTCMKTGRTSPAS